MAPMESSFEVAARMLARRLSWLSRPEASLAALGPGPAEDLTRLLDRWSPSLGTDSSPALDLLAEELCRLALQGDDRRAALGAGLLFGTAAERLADSFDPDRVALYDALFARVIDRARGLPAGEPIDRCLSALGVASAAGLLTRKSAARAQRLLPLEQTRCIRKVIVPSRVTLGADVAVTSVVLQKVERVLPAAECVVVGPIAVAELLSRCAAGVRFVDCPYDRRGGLGSRLEAWVRAVEIVRLETASLQPGAWAVLDPDSRLTQLGLLPLAPAAGRACFFESRGYRVPGVETLGELTGRWMEEVLGPDGCESILPRIVPHPGLLSAARALAARSRSATGVPMAVVTFGSGGNDRKRLPGGFEHELVRALLAEGGDVVFDKGVAEEIGRAEDIIRTVAGQGTAVVELGSELGAPPATRSPRLLVHHAGLASLAAVVAASGTYVGYDSALQHVAAAVGTPTIDIFVDPPGDLFARRWRPCSRAPVHAIEVRTAAAGAAPERGALATVLEALRRIRSAEAA